MNGLVKEGSIGAVLFRAKIITEEELLAALEVQKASGCRIGEALVHLGAVTQEDIDWALAHQLNIPYVRLKRQNIDDAALALVPERLARRYNLVPLHLIGTELSIAIADPLDGEALSALESETGCQINLSVGLMREIRAMLDLCYGEGEGGRFGFSSSLFSAKALEAMNADLSGATLLNHLLLCIVRQKFALLALQPVGETVTVVARHQGASQEIARLPLSNYALLLSRIRKLARLEHPEEISSSGVIWFLWRGKKIPFQVLMLRGTGGDYVTLKLHVTSAPLTGISDLKMSRAREEDLRALTCCREGLVLFATDQIGLCAELLDLFLESCDTAEKTVLLLGERVGRGKKGFPRIPVQRGGGDQTRLLLGAALEHEPDILVVEDITDVDTFVAASRAVLRGRLVLAGMAVAGLGPLLDRLQQLRLENYLIPSQLRGVVCCKTVHLLCSSCRQSYHPAPEEISVLGLSSPPAEFYRAVGCPACDYTGYSAKRYLLDVIRSDRAFVQLFQGTRTGSQVLRLLKESGYHGIAEEGTELLAKGEISPAEFIASILL